MNQLATLTPSNLTAPNQFVTAANGGTFAYRRFGNTDGPTLPLVCFQHYRGNLDNWDPALVDAIARAARGHPVRQRGRRRINRRSTPHGHPDGLRRARVPRSPRPE